MGRTDGMESARIVRKMLKTKKISVRTFCFPEFCVNFATVFGVTAGSGSVISHVALEFLSIKRIIKDGLD